MKGKQKRVAARKIETPFFTRYSHLKSLKNHTYRNKNPPFTLHSHLG